MAENDFIIKGGLLKEYVGAGGDIVIPDAARRIGERAFYACTSITSVTIPASVIMIDRGAFARCKNLQAVIFLGEEIEFTGSSSYIDGGSGAFQWCSSLRKIGLPKKTTMRDNKCFSECPQALGAFSYFPSQKEKIQGALLWLSGNCDEHDDEKAIIAYSKRQRKAIFEKIIEGSNHPAFVRLCTILDKPIPADELDQAISKVKSHAELTAALLEYKNKCYSVEDIAKAAQKKIDKALGAAKLTLADIKKEWRMDPPENHSICITGYFGNEKEIITPVYEGDSPIDSIGSFGLSPNRPRRPLSDKQILNSIKKITVGPEIKRIWNRAFDGCMSLESVEILGEGVALYTGLFKDCSRLTEIILPKTVNYKGNPFLDCPLYKGQNNDLYIVDNTLFGCTSSNKKIVKLPKTITAISTFAFDGCEKLTDVYIPETVTGIVGQGYFGRRPVIHTPAGSAADQYYRKQMYKVINDI